MVAIMGYRKQDITTYGQTHHVSPPDYQTELRPYTASRIQSRLSLSILLLYINQQVWPMIVSLTYSAESVRKNGLISPFIAHIPCLPIRIPLHHRIRLYSDSSFPFAPSHTQEVTPVTMP
jgi:hypothetical protein